MAPSRSRVCEWEPQISLILTSAMRSGLERELTTSCDGRRLRQFGTASARALA